MPAKRPSVNRLQKNPTPSPKPREEPTEYEKNGAVSMGENGAPGEPSHLMPSPQANGGNLSHQEEKDLPAVDDLSEEELHDRGYPNPDQTQDSDLKSMRTNEDMVAQVQGRIEKSHKMLEEKLDSIQEQARQEEELATQHDDDVDYPNLPNAPKGDVLVLGPNEPLRVSGDVQGNVILLDKAVYRAHRPFRSLRWAFTLVHQKGTVVPVSAVRGSVPQPTPTEPQGTDETKTPEAPHNANDGASQTKEPVTKIETK